MTGISITAEGARSGSLRTGWSGGAFGYGKGARRDGAEHDQRRNHPEVVQGVGEKGRGSIRGPDDRQLYLHQRGRRRPHQQEHFQNPVLATS